jgi:hypothetical protein
VLRTSEYLHASEGKSGRIALRAAVVLCIKHRAAAEAIVKQLGRAGSIADYLGPGQRHPPCVMAAAVVAMAVQSGGGNWGKGYGSRNGGNGDAMASVFVPICATTAIGHCRSYNACTRAASYMRVRALHRTC